MIKIELKGAAWQFKSGGVRLTRAVMAEVGDEAAEGYKARLDKGMGVDSSGRETRLAPLSALTIGRKGSSIPLVDTGGMKDSFQVDKSALTERRAVVAFSPEQAMKAGVLQAGAKIAIKHAKALRIPVGPGRGAGRSSGAIYRKSVTIPPRPHVGLSDRDKEGIVKVLQPWARGLLA